MIIQYIIAQVHASTLDFYRYFIHKQSKIIPQIIKNRRITPFLVPKTQIKNVYTAAYPYYISIIIRGISPQNFRFQGRL